MLVRIVRGTYGHRVNGIVKPVKHGEICEVDERIAARLFSLGIAESAEPPAPPDITEPENPKPVPGKTVRKTRKK